MPQKVFRDPVYGDISLTLPADQVLLDLINTATFQRLRRIRQLGVSHVVYHGAEHSRIGHSLGVMHLMTIAIDHLIISSVGTDRQVLTRYRQAARIAALLHDIGHGPFSHNFEQIIPSSHARRHELWSAQIVCGDTDIARVLRKARIDPEVIAAIINKTFTSCPVIQELLSGHLDVDRMDYLLRDSHMTGVKYGIFDWQRLVRSLTVYHRRETMRLALTMKGMHALEELLLARYFMYEQVYLHKTVLAAEFMLKQLLARAGYLIEHQSLAIGNAALARLFSHQTLTVEDYCGLDDTTFMAEVMSWMRHADPVLADLATRIVNRDVFVSIACTPKELPALAKRAREAATKIGLDPDYYIGTLDTSLTPYPPYSSEKSTFDIAIITPDGPRYAPEVSEIIKQFQGKAFRTTRICMPREVRAKLV